MHNSSECVSLLMEEGYAGYGIYMAMLEVLRDAPSYKYSSEPATWAWLLRSADKDQIQRVIRNYGLFDFDNDGLMFSPWLNGQLSDYSDKKAKLQEAGRRGAAKRWAAATTNDGQAIATPSGGDGQAIAYNTTQLNLTQQNETLPNGTNAQAWRDVVASSCHKITEEDYTTAVAAKQFEGTQAFVFQECYRRGISWEAFKFILSHSNGAEVGNHTYQAFCALCRRVDTEKYPVKLPDNFFLSKLFG